LGGGAGSDNTSYAAGSYNGSPVADYFLFDLTGATTAPVTSVALVIYSGTITNNLTLNLTGLSDSTIAGLTNDQAPPDNTALYTGLTTGPSYGSFALSPGESGETLTFALALTAAELTALNQDIVDGPVGIGGSVSGIPEPSTWIMMLAGFAGLGYIAHRRAAKRRAAAAAG
jgi:hypothetical protein